MEDSTAKPPTTPADAPASPAPAPAAPPAPAEPAKPLSAIDQFHADPAFKDHTIQLARDLAGYIVGREVDAATAEVRAGYVAKTKAAAIKDHLSGMAELAYLLPDVDDPRAMNEAASKLRRRLASLAPMMPTTLRTERPPTAAELINYGLEIRRSMGTSPRRFGE